jgi:hypothetical protein
MLRASLGFASPNVLASLCASILPATLIAFSRLGTSIYGRIAFGIMVCFLTICLVASASRGGMIAAIIGMLAATLLSAGRIRRTCALGVVVLIILSSIGTMGLRWSATATTQPSVATRLYLWQTSAVIAADHAFCGLGGDAQAFGLACVATAPPPPHLQSAVAIPFTHAINDPLDIAAKHGLPLALCACAAALLPLITGFMAWARGATTAGSCLAASGAAWIVAGQFSCVWFFDPYAAVLAWLTASVAIIATARVVGFSILSKSIGTSLGIALIWACTILLSGQLLAGDRPRLGSAQKADGPVRWMLIPRSRSLGLVTYIAEEGESEEDLLRYVLRPIAMSGFTAMATVPNDLQNGTTGILVAHGRMAGTALPAGSANGYQTVILLDPPAECADQPCAAPVLIAVHGEKSLARDRDAWRMRLGQRALLAPCPRVWDTRISMVWPMLVPMLTSIPH